MHNAPPMHPSDFPGPASSPVRPARGGAAHRPHARRALALALGMALATASLPWATAAADLRPAPPTPSPAGVPPAAVLRYDAARDAAADIDRALGAAAAGGRRVLLIVGGDWCKDCRELDALLAREPALAQARDARFVPVKVYVGSDNRNEAVLARYPKLNWVPTLIELDASGAATRSTPSTELHSTDGLDPVRVRAFFAGS
jgi:thiol:disulfide interchange protein